MCTLFCASSSWDPLLLVIVFRLKNARPRHQAHVSLIYRPGPYFSFLLSFFSPPNNFKNFGAHLKGRNASISGGWWLWWSSSSLSRERERTLRGLFQQQWWGLFAFCVIGHWELRRRPSPPTNWATEWSSFLSFSLPFYFYSQRMCTQRWAASITSIMQSSWFLTWKFTALQILVKHP